MTANAGYHLFTTGDVLTAAQVQYNLQNQTIMYFASSAARTSALSGVVVEGMFSYLADTNSTEYYDGAAWQSISNPGDITGVTAGTGISGGGTSGTVTVSIDTAVTVDKTTAQTLTNKTLTSPALTTPTISTLTTNGDLLYGTGSGALSRLGIGSSAQVLTVASGVPSWATPAGGGGKVLQVVQGTASGYIAITSINTYSDANLSVAITPTLNTSKILIFINQQLSLYTNTAAQPNGGYMKILRGSTDIWTGSSTQPTIGQQEAVNGGPFAIAAMTYLDSPATTSSTTYKTQWKQITNAYDHTLYMNYGTFQSTITLMEIGA